MVNFASAFSDRPHFAFTHFRKDSAVTLRLVSLPLLIAFLFPHITFGADQDADSGAQSPMDVDSPLLKPWTGPYGGVPPWNLVRSEEFIPAFEVAIKWAGDELNEIANNPEPPTFDNTILAMQNSGEALRRLQSIFFVYASNLNVGPIPDIEKAVVPKLSEHEDSIYQNKALLDRITTIYESDAMSDGTFTLAQRRIVDDLYKSFVRNGARLDDGDKAKLSQINTRLARLFTDFSQNVLEDEKGFVTWIDDKSKLAGLPDSTIDAMAGAAKERGNKDGQWAITNTRSSMDPVLTYADDRDLREGVWRNYYNRGDNGDEHDNNAIIAEILKLRAARAKCSAIRHMPIGEWSRRWRRRLRRRWT